MDSGPDQQQPLRLPWWMWLLALGSLAACVFLIFQPGPASSVSIPYSTFIDQVRAGNVKSVQIDGSVITGVFNTPILWPTSTPGAAQSGTPTAAAPA
ncbi:MAG: ATP-dependent metallopeptidase FtsH/Yme1/Tma family protein, partial [Anaerolineae bacterium]